jgi:CBS domain
MDASAHKKSRFRLCQSTLARPAINISEPEIRKRQGRLFQRLFLQCGRRELALIGYLSGVDTHHGSASVNSPPLSTSQTQSAAHQLSARKSSLSEGATGTALAGEPFRRKTRVEEKEIRMKVSEIMTRDVCLASPSQTLRKAAAEMGKRDIGVPPVGEKDRLVGMITDRDIAIRGISRGLGPDTPVREVMSAEVKCCFENDAVEILPRTWPPSKFGVCLCSTTRSASWASSPSGIWPRPWTAVRRE